MSAIVLLRCRNQGLDFFVGIKPRGFFLQNQVSTHATTREILHAFVVFCTIGMSIKVTTSTVANIFQELYQKKGLLNHHRTKAEILIKTSKKLIVQVDMEQFTHIPSLRYIMQEVKTCHMLMRDFRIHADHFRVVKAGNKTKHRTRR